MKVKLYIDLPNDYYIQEDAVFATSNPSSEAMDTYTRYVINAELPVKHFRPAKIVEVDCELIGEVEK